MEEVGLTFTQFDNQYLFFENYQIYNLIKIKKDLSHRFEKVDDEIFLSSWRKKFGYIPDGFKSRTIITIYGAVTFKRRVYKYWKQGRYHYVFLADKKLQIEKYQRVSIHLKFKILEHLATGKRHRDICDIFKFADLTRATISNITKSFDLSALRFKLSKNIIKARIPQYLYINMDETFIKLRKNNKMQKYRIRLVTFHTGYDLALSTDKRKVLANKRVYYKMLPISKKIDTTNFFHSLEKFAKKYYYNVDKAKIIIGGDGASWIRETVNYWPNANYILDKFHAMRYLKQICFHATKQFYPYYRNLFNIGAYKLLFNQIKQTPISPSKQQKVKKVLTYFNNNLIGIINQNSSWNIGVSAEGDVSHIVKWLLSYGSKAFNYLSFCNMLFLKTAEINHLDVFTFLHKQYEKDKKMIKDFYWTSNWNLRNNFYFF